MATLFGGQVLLEKPTKSSLSRVVRQLLKVGVETHLSALSDAYFLIPVISQKELQAISRLLQKPKAAKNGVELRMPLYVYILI